MKGQNPDIDATHNFGFCSRSARQLRASGGYVSVFQFSCSKNSRPQLDPNQLGDTPAFEAALADLFLGPEKGLGLFVPGTDEGIDMLL